MENPKWKIVKRKFNHLDLLRIYCRHITDEEQEFFDVEFSNWLDNAIDICENDFSQKQAKNIEDIKLGIINNENTNVTVTENTNDEDLEKLTHTLFDQIQEKIDTLLTNPLAVIPQEVLEKLPDNVVLTLYELLTLEESTKQTIHKILSLILELLNWIFILLGLVVVTLDYVILAIRGLDWLRNTWLFNRPGLRQVVDFVFDRYLNLIVEKITMIKDYIRLVKLAIIEILEEILLLLQNAIK